MHITVPYKKNSPAPDVSSAKAEKPWSGPVHLFISKNASQTWASIRITLVLLTHRWLGPTQRCWFSKSGVGLESLCFWGVPRDANIDGAGPGTTLWEPLLYKKGEWLDTALACVDPLGDTTVYTLSTCFVSFWDIFTWSLHVPTCFPVKPNCIWQT